MKKNRIVIFQLTPKEKVKLHFKGPFVAMANGISIKIDEYFNKFSLEEQRAIVWHEMYHHKYNGVRLLPLWLKNLWLIILLRKNKYNASQLLELEADAYSAEMCGKENTLNFLNKLKEFYKKGIIEYDETTHPPVEERIKMVKGLKEKNAKN